MYFSTIIYIKEKQTNREKNKISVIISFVFSVYLVVRLLFYYAVHQITEKNLKNILTNNQFEILIL